MTSRRKIYLGLIAVLAIATFFSWRDVFALSGPSYLKVDVLSIGQGDSIFIQTPDMRHILIDGGPGQDILGKLQSRLPLWDRKLDVIILTHPDADHLQGLLAVLQKYQADYIIWTGITREGQGYQEWLRLLEKQKARGAKVIQAKQGLQISNGQVVIDTLHPFEVMEGKTVKEGNDTGIVSRLQYGSKSFLFTADISSNVEYDLVGRGTTLASDVLKVPHHGSKYSSSDEFLEAVHPGIAAISVGARNSYGHPTKEVLQRLESFGISILRTDRHGDIKFSSDGSNIHIK